MIEGSGAEPERFAALSGHILFPVNYCQSAGCDLWKAICVTNTGARS